MTKNNNLPKVIVLGIGNTLYTDEGVGIEILPQVEEEIHKRGLSHVSIHEGSTDSLSLLSVIEEADYLLIIDAINAGKEPGTIIELTADEIPAYFGVKMSVHQVGFQEVLFAARLLEQLPKDMHMVGCQPYSLELGVGISEEMKSLKVPELIELVFNQISKWSE